MPWAIIAEFVWGRYYGENYGENNQFDKREPQITNKELAEACGITEDGVYWNTKKLNEIAANEGWRKVHPEEAARMAVEYVSNTQKAFSDPSKPSLVGTACIWPNHFVLERRIFNGLLFLIPRGNFNWLSPSSRRAKPSSLFIFTLHFFGCKGTTVGRGVFRYLTILTDSYRFLPILADFRTNIYAIAVDNPLDNIGRQYIADIDCFKFARRIPPEFRLNSPGLHAEFFSATLFPFTPLLL